MSTRRAFSWLLIFALAVAGGELSFLTGWKISESRHKVIAPVESNIERLHAASVMIRADRSSGSGTIFQDRHGALLVLTAAHVVEGCKTVELVQTTVLHGERLFDVAIDAEVIEVDEKLDLALLRPKSPKAFSAYIKHVARIYSGSAIPGIGTPVTHVGSMCGAVGERSVTFGTIAGLARKMDDGAFLDQMTAAAAPGSSGGGIFDAGTSELIGVLVRGYSDSFTFFVPARDINKFLENTKH